MRRFLLVLLIAVPLAGCLAGGPAPSSTLGSCASPFDQPGLRLLAPATDPMDDEKANATVFATTNVRTCSLPAIGWTALQANGVPHKYLGEEDMRGDLNLGVVAVVGSGETGGVYVLDITNRSAPAVLAFLLQSGAHVTDVKISDDGKILYTASQQTPGPEMVSSAPQLRAQMGFTAYSLADPRHPAYLGTVIDAGFGCHMLEPVQVAVNQDAVFCVSEHIRSYLVQRDNGVLVNLGFVDYVPSKNGLPTPSAPAVVGDPTCAAGGVGPALCALTVGPHDMTVFHEGGAFRKGNSYLVVSHWDEGVKVLDITNAPQVTEVGSWKGEGAKHYDGNVHTAMMFLAGGHRYVMASPEYTQEGQVPSLWVLNADDIAHLKLVAEWSHPGQHASQGLYLTTHQWQVAPTGANATADQVHVYLTYNHAGVWVLDLGQILAGNNTAAILGYNLARTPIPDDHVANAILSTWDVNVVDGYIYGTDRATGLWVFHYAGDTLGDKAMTGFA